MLHDNKKARVEENVYKKPSPARMRSEDYCSRSVCVCVCVCPCVRVSVRLSTVFLGNRGNSERETWTYHQVGGMHGKLRFWSGEGRGSW